MDPPTIIPVANETHSTFARNTVDGRTITYSLKVLQQPVRARACGQGAKSSADRRPVDPPPIVELTMHQGSEKATAEDITFSMNANYFLFATLEQARPIAQGRLPQEKNTPPVLTGTPVAGMVYLDRPKPAGYFIFPDLSVRHEGKYRLSFSLYEELKNAKDQDRNEDGSQPPSPADDHCFMHRLDVRSEPFHVYSAKKFPGLTESTSLSRMVAEQGCRVRIRRDVRMRRREPKGSSKEWDEYEDETAAARARHSATPDPSVHSAGYMDQMGRPRSSSNASHHSMGTVFSRRPSLQDINFPAQQAQYPVATPGGPPAYPTQSAPAYGAPPQSQQQYQPAPFVQQQQAPMQPPPPSLHQAQTYVQAPPAYSSQQGSYYNTSSAPSPSAAQVQYPSSTGYDAATQSQRSSADYSSSASQDFRRNSTPHIPPPPPPASQTAYVQQPPLPPAPSQSYQSHPYAQPPPPPSQNTNSQPSFELYSTTRSGPPIEPMQPPVRANGAHTPTAVKPSFALPPLTTSMNSSAHKLEASSPASYSGIQSSYFSSSSSQTPQDTHKRSYGKVFSDRHQNGPLRQGARPSLYGQDSSIPAGTILSAVDDDDNASIDLDEEVMGMSYRRADGRQIRRPLPGHN